MACGFYRVIAIRLVYADPHLIGSQKPPCSFQLTFVACHPRNRRVCTNIEMRFDQSFRTCRGVFSGLQRKMAILAAALLGVSKRLPGLSGVRTVQPCGVIVLHLHPTPVIEVFVHKLGMASSAYFRCRQHAFREICLVLLGFQAYQKVMQKYR